MANCSKLTHPITYNCYEVVHTWTPSCAEAALGLGFSSFTEALKIYIPFYLFAQLVQKKFDMKSTLQTAQSIWSSSAFIGFAPFVFSGLICIFRKYFGKFYCINFGFLPGIIATFLGFLIEKESRRGPVSVYGAFVASETLFRMALARKILKPIPVVEVYLFCTIVASLMYISRKHGLSKDIVGLAIKYIVGTAEFSSPVAKSISEPREEANGACAHKSPLTPKTVLSNMRASLSKIWNVIKHRSCPHNDSCFHYAVEGFFRPLFFGYAAYLSMRCLRGWSAIRKDPALFKKLMTDRKTANIGLLLGGFAGTFRLLSCLFRWLSGENKEIYVIPAAFVAGLFMKFAPNSTLTLYLSWKLAEILYLIGMRKGVLPEVKGFRLILYSVSVGILSHACMFEPQNLKPEYWKFLKTVSYGVIEQVNRPLLYAYGKHTIEKYPDFWPDLDLKYVSKNFMETYLLWTIH